MGLLSASFEAVPCPTAVTTAPGGAVFITPCILSTENL
jgi:hypothetical protein